MLLAARVFPLALFPQPAELFPVAQGALVVGVEPQDLPESKVRLPVRTLLNILIGLAEPFLYFPLLLGAASGLRARAGGRWRSRLGGFGLRFLRRRYLC